MKLPESFTERSDHINVIIETPKGSGIKYTFDKRTGFFKLSKILPQGMHFPLHFGFIPNTKADDGDPLDVLVLMDEPSYPGCFIECRLIGVIEAEQTEKNGEKVRNDRLIAVAVESHRYREYKNINDIEKYMLEEVIEFFIGYNKLAGKKFKVLAKGGQRQARRLVKKQVV